MEKIHNQKEQSGSLRLAPNARASRLPRMTTIVYGKYDTHLFLASYPARAHITRTLYIDTSYAVRIYQLTILNGFTEQCAYNLGLLCLHKAYSTSRCLYQHRMGLDGERILSTEPQNRLLRPLRLAMSDQNLHLHRQQQQQCRLHRQAELCTKGHSHFRQ
jgi:hypothetical protein